ncbi:MAG: Nramp family divalent metal transporter [Planctomycetaceae bacterium]|nr:Nramp family divalent metal transporter [Planctomycetales bacterium]MCB9927709.1 Nramp family divalent metal transporter [Planctomycetaceae bacterium]
MPSSDSAQHDVPAADDVTLTETPPTAIGGILRRLGPGLIVAGSIVGSGELIATTKTGAEAGFWLLWLILIGCVIKVFCQVEFGRYSIVTGNSTMTGLAEVPGPGIPGRGNWLVWYWFLMWFASIGQLGGIVGGVGQALSISIPLTQQGRDFNEYVDRTTELKVNRAELALIENRPSGGDEGRINELHTTIARLTEELAGVEEVTSSYDDRIWATIIAVATAVILVLGHYGFIQSFSTVMVCGFTLVTVVNLAFLQANASWAVTLQDIVNGMSFRLPPNSTTAVATALATFGIIGVGASELVTYPYWCLEKGYARFTGPRDESQQWADRASGWMRVMRWDAWCSMVVYTFATIAFYLLGAAILGRTQLNPEKSEMIRTLAVMYEPVFTESASLLFLFGAFAVLYSTYFVANASHARVFSDTLGVLGVASKDSAAIRRRVRILSGFFPLLCVAMYLYFPNPAKLVLISGVMQGIMLPMLAGAGLFFRYKRCDARITPGKVWDTFLWVSAIGMLVTGLWTVWSTVAS